MSSARRVTWTALLVEPIALTLAIVSIALAYTVVVRPPDANAADFYTFWDSARMYREGRDLYLAQVPRPGLGYNLNLPAAVVLFLPFSLLDLVPAFVAWTTLSVALLAYAGWRIASVTGYRSPIVVISAVFISQATFSALQLGQVTAILMVLFTEAWIADRRNRAFVSGLLLGVVIGLKPFLGFFALYAVWRKERPLILGLLSGATVISLIGWLIMGADGFRSWFEVLQRATWSAHLGNGSLLAALQRLLTSIPDLAITPVAVREDWITPLRWTLVACVIAVGIRAIARDADRDRGWLIVCLGSLLVSPLGWTYYAPLAAGPLAGYLDRASRRGRWLAAIGYAWLCVPYTVMSWPYGPLLSALLASASTWGVAGLYLAAVQNRRLTPASGR